MLSAIDFDDKLAFAANEIDNKWSDRLLAHKFRVMQPA